MAPTADDLPRDSRTIPLAGFERPPERIGPYHILKTLGEGGMGIVYLAEQEEPVERRVALKVIKLGMDTKEVVARFEAERQALALMDHPNIAKVLEAGMTEQGRPFFAMEYVAGTAVIDHCDRHRLDTKERIRLFTQVCLGIHHAHQKGIIHRDLKPSNILVMLQDGKPVPKVIDFGVAKATNRRLTERTLYTQQGLMVGTPAYMSPEQAEMTGLDVDTATDIYSLGVLLYELLTGTLPFDPDELRRMGLESVHRVIREVDPARPSTRVRDLKGEKAAVLATRRRTEPQILQRELRGELDWIVMKAMEKDRTRRYASAAEFAADIDRYLTHHPVTARPPSTLYQLQKMVARHTTAVSFAGIFFLSLIVFGIWMSFLYARATRAEQAAVAARQEATVEAETATQVTDFLVDLFKVPDPNEALGKTITAQEILDRGAGKIDTELRGQPLVQARLMDTMGQVYGRLGLFDQGGSLLKKALATRETELGGDHLEVASTLYHLGEILNLAERKEESLVVHQRALEIRKRILGLDDVDTGRSLWGVGTVLAWLGRSEAEDYLQQAQEVFEACLGPDDVLVAWCINDLARVYATQGDLETAIPLFKRTLEIKERQLGPDHYDVAIALSNLGYALTLAEQYEEAEPYVARSLKLKEAIYGPDHPQTATSLHSLGELYRLQGKLHKAREVLERTLTIQERVFGNRSAPVVALTTRSFGCVLRDLGDYQRSEELFKRSLSVYRDTLEPNHPDIALCLKEFALLLRQTGRPEEAEELERQAEAILLKS